VLPVIDALYNGHESRANRFGSNGAYTNILSSEMTDLRRFWDIDGGSIVLTPLHADIYSSTDRMRLLYLQIGMTAQQATSLAQLVDLLLSLDPVLRHGQNPVFTFNAFAFDPDNDPEFGVLPRKIVVGDGLLDGLHAIGLDDKAFPRAVLAHEYGHHVQFQKGLLASGPSTPELSRRAELMADAFGTYYAVHARGAALNAARTLDDQRTFYNVGDCGFANPDHHGTPLQRFRTAQWAASVVTEAPDQGHRLGGVEFARLFDAQLPVLVAPDSH
jgi:hypothetical protein